MPAPDTLTLERNRDMVGRGRWLHVRRFLLALLVAVLIAALFNVFGQRPQSVTAATPRASLKVYAPTRVRSGLIYAARFQITAREDIKDAFLVLDPGWADGYTVNGAAPQPLTEASRDGRIAFGFGHISAGHSLLFFLSLQVNPTNVGRHSQDLSLDDGETPILTVHRTVTIFP
jgi:hypothetical protein